MLASAGHVALTAVLVAGCGSSSDAGVEVQVISAPISLGEPRVIETDLGFEVRLDSAFWTSSEVELVPCNTALGRLARSWIRSAHAHGTSTPTLLASPIVESARSTEALALGRLAPPAGRYCSVRYALGPADADARGLDAAAHMAGRSFELRAAFRRPGEPYVDFEVESAALLETVSTLGPLDLTRRTSRATLRIDRDPRRWFDGIDFAVAGATAAALLDNVRTSLTVTVE